MSFYEIKTKSVIRDAVIQEATRNDAKWVKYFNFDATQIPNHILALDPVLADIGSRGDFDDAGGGALAEFDDGVDGIGDGLAVEVEPVEVAAGLEGAGGEGPEAVGIFGEGLGLGVGHPIGPESDFCGFGREEAEGGGLVGVEFRGDLGEEGDGEEEQLHVWGSISNGVLDSGDGFD